MLPFLKLKFLCKFSKFFSLSLFYLFLYSNTKEADIVINVPKILRPKLLHSSWLLALASYIHSFKNRFCLNTLPLNHFKLKNIYHFYHINHNIKILIIFHKKV